MQLTTTAFGGSFYVLVGLVTAGILILGGVVIVLLLRKD